MNMIKKLFAKKIKKVAPSIKGFKTLSEMINKEAFAVELAELVSGSFKNPSWNDVYRSVQFPTKNILILSVHKYDSKDAINLTYFDEMKKAPVGVIVPGSFALKPLEGSVAEKLQKKYHETIIKDLQRHIYYEGTIGTDPEIFAVDEKEKLIPAFKFLPSRAEADKKNKYFNGKTYWDGFQAEFTTESDSCMDGLTSYIGDGLSALKDKLNAFNPKAKLSIKSVFDLTDEDTVDAKKEHMAFGCAPSKNVYGLKGLRADGRKVKFRTAGGHIHFGFYNNKEHPKSQEEIEKMVKALDAILGVACVSLFASLDTPKRRAMYGLAGEYRTPTHGLEYRALSNAWLCHPFAANLVFDLARSALIMGINDLLQYWKGNEKETVECINNCDVKKAREILDRNMDLFKQVVNIRYGDKARVNLVVKTVLEGIESKVKDPANVEKNWCLIGDNEYGIVNVGRAVSRKGKI